MTVTLSIGLIISDAAATPITISVLPAMGQVFVGDTVSVALEIAGLGDDGTAPSVSAFHLDLAFNRDVLRLENVVFGDPGLGNQLDLAGLGTVQMVDTSTLGRVNLFELSFDSPLDLDGLQASSFIMATMTFSAVAVGGSPLNLNVLSLADSAGSPLTATAMDSVVLSKVPEPTTVMLTSIGLLGLLTIRRAKRPPRHLE